MDGLNRQTIVLKPFRTVLAYSNPDNNSICLPPPTSIKWLGEAVPFIRVSPVGVEELSLPPGGSASRWASGRKME